ncbi:STAS domain-containing protein [Streptomyces goshikiensis]|uniref:STAS domain-containing protein n=1 Tax=Streptomyces goshikiensis TaxID=1942 RepID=UPI003320EF97
MEQQVTVLPDIDGIRVITCTGEYDQETLEPLRQAAAQAASDPAVRTIVLDVSKVVFADSSMLNEMIQLRHSSRPLVLAGPLPPQLNRLFDLTSAHQVFTITDSLEAARAL